MAVTKDQLLWEFGTPDPHQPLNAGVGATVQLYRGTIAGLTGTGANAGYLKNMDTPASTDVVIGMINKGGPGYPDTIPGILGGATNGAVTAEILTGTFLLASGTGADQLSVATAGSNVYVINSITVGATSGGGTRPLAGVQMPAGDLTNLPVGVGGLYPIKFTVVGSP
jgi:hypothetical protein